MDPFDRLLGSSAEMEAVRDFGRRAAAVDAPVLLTGESGTGKGLLARAIHDASARARRAFVAVNCAGVPETLFESHFFGHDRGAFTGAQQTHRGLFEQADGGTLFLDEIAELPLALQAKLLTALEDGEIRRLGSEHVVRVSPRVIAAAGCGLACSGLLKPALGGPGVQPPLPRGLSFVSSRYWSEATFEPGFQNISKWSWLALSVSSCESSSAMASWRAAAVGIREHRPTIRRS